MQPRLRERLAPIRQKQPRAAVGNCLHAAKFAIAQMRESRRYWVAERAELVRLPSQKLLYPLLSSHVFLPAFCPRRVEYFLVRRFGCDGAQFREKIVCEANAGG